MVLGPPASARPVQEIARRDGGGLGGSMRGLSFAGDRRIEFLDVPDPTPGPGEVVLAMKASGMCGSDLKMYRAPRGTLKIARVDNTKPVIAGHEPCGVVAA